MGAYRFEKVGFDRGKGRAIIETSKKQNNISNNLHLGECFRSRYASCYGLAYTSTRVSTYVCSLFGKKAASWKADFEI
jgi:hypothetical protein